ncbi:MAG: hypothetical protein RQM92_16330 [Candidatus Syntrophopropionicum ammoniitolerans]
MGYNKFGSGQGERRLKILAIFVIAVFVIMGTFVAANYKHVSNLVKVIAIVRTQYLQPVASDQMIDGAIKGIVDSLNDPYSVYLNQRPLLCCRNKLKAPLAVWAFLWV